MKKVLTLLLLACIFSLVFTQGILEGYYDNDYYDYYGLSKNLYSLDSMDFDDWGYDNYSGGGSYDYDGNDYSGGSYYDYEGDYSAGDSYDYDGGYYDSGSYEYESDYSGGSSYDYEGDYSDGGIYEKSNGEYTDGGSYETSGGEYTGGGSYETSNGEYTGGGSYETSGGEYTGGGSYETSGGEYTGGGSYETSNGEYTGGGSYDDNGGGYSGGGSLIIENEVTDEDIEINWDDIIEYIIITNPYIFFDEYKEIEVKQVPDKLAGMLVNWEVDTRKYPYRARVATRGGNLNVRSGPSTGYPVVGRLPNGCKVVVYGRSSDLNWAYVAAENGVQGFVLDAYITTKNVGVSTSAPKIPSVKKTGKISIETNALDGTHYTSNDLFGNNYVTAINFWATYCGPCISEIPDIDAINEALKDNYVQFVGIAVDACDAETIEEAKKILADAKAHYLNLQPPKNLDDIIRISATPTTIFVDYEGNVWGEPIEGADPDAYIDRLISIMDAMQLTE